MAEKMTGIGVEWATSVETSERREQGRTRGRGAYGVAAAVLVVVLIGGVMMHDRQETGSVALATEHINKAERQYAVTPSGSVALVTEHINKAERLYGVVTQVRDDGTVETGFIGVRLPDVVSQTQWRFVENNTMNLPDAVTAESRPIVTSQQQKFLDVNTVMLPTGQGIGPQECDAILTALDKVGTASTQAVRGYTPRFGSRV